MNRREFCLVSTVAVFSTTQSVYATMKANNASIYVPAEEEPHELTFMQWPVSETVYNDRNFLDDVQATIARIANAISEFESVVLLADKRYHRKAKQQLSDQVELWDIPTEDLWCRDSGPLFGLGHDGSLVVSHIQFNGWGEKQKHHNDAQIAKLVGAELGVPIISSGLYGEAGGVEHDGHGLLLAHESSWVNDNRNPGMDRSAIEQRLLNAYGAKSCIWSAGVWDKDITDYHIDSLARFTGPGRILINLPQYPDAKDPFHRAALDTLAVLESENLEIDIIYEPNRRRVKHAEFVASYVNYYVCNDAVIAAQLGDAETDEDAFQALKKHYPGREIVMLNVDALGEIGGGIHCATQQLPAMNA